jgi:hypothetical protein
MDASLPQPKHSIRAWILFASFLLDLSLVFIGIALIEYPFCRVIPVHSISAVILRRWALSIVCATGIGFLAHNLWKSHTAKWAWILPAFWFVFWAVVAVGAGESSAQFTGSACDSLASSNCRYFLFSTLPFIRAIFYSVGALISSSISAHSKFTHPNNHLK